VRTLLTAIGALLSLTVLSAQTAAPPLAPAAIDAAVRDVVDVFANEYFDLAVSRIVATELESRVAAGEYHDAIKPADLARRLTAEFFELTRDKHVAVAIAQRGGGSAGSASERRDVPTTAGFRRSEIIDGNVGVLDMAFFLRPIEHRGALADAMRKLQPADALILDMRENGGGSPGTVALLISYLLEPPERPLFEIVQRSGPRQTYRTEPVQMRNARRPVYVLTSRRSFSGGEGLAFLLQDLKRAVVIGEVTAGAANPGRPYPAGDLFDVTVPNGQLLTSVTKRNWEGSGVTPDIPVPASDAFRIAHLRAIDDLMTTATPARRGELARIRERLAGSPMER
jgi:retinol-binding protein 3